MCRAHLCDPPPAPLLPCASRPSPMPSRSRCRRTLGEAKGLAVERLWKGQPARLGRYPPAVNQRHGARLAGSCALSRTDCVDSPPPRRARSKQDSLQGFSDPGAHPTGGGGQRGARAALARCLLPHRPGASPQTHPTLQTLKVLNPPQQRTSGRDSHSQCAPPRLPPAAPN
jgi:hypothetical protein